MEMHACYCTKLMCLILCQDLVPDLEMVHAPPYGNAIVKECTICIALS